MSSVNLNVVGAETFGARLPTVFIQSIEVDPLIDDEGTTHAYGHSVKITATLSIKFTSPGHLQHETIKEFIDEHLGNLYLYAYITTDDLQWAEALENESLSLLEWHRYLDNLDDDGIDTDAIACVKHLEDLATGDDGAVLIKNNSFDGEGNEIIEISGITCEFDYIAGTEGDSGAVLDVLENVEKLFLFATVGIRRSQLESNNLTSTHSSSDSPDPGVIFGEARSFSNQTYNSFFGNITYYQVLERANTASRFYSQYSRPSGSPYLEFVLQSINGKFYSTDNYGYTDLKAAFEATIAEFSAERDSDSILNKNISDLEAIILSEYNRTNILGEIANYSSTYPNKDQNTASGRFFNSFVVTYAEVLQIVQSQEELSQRLYLDSLVIDNREGGLIGDYEYPTPPDFERGSPSDPSSDFIPQNWLQIERRAFPILSLTEAQGGAYMSATALGGRMEAWTSVTSDVVVGADASSGEYGVLVKAFRDQYEEEGYSYDEADEMAREEVEYQLTTGDTGVAGELLGSLEYSEDLNFIVRNKGYFYFDYEKALRTQSIASKVLNLTKIQQYFRRAIPYKYFYLQTVKLTRQELYVGLPSDPAATSIECSIYADFDDRVTGLYENYDGEMLTRPDLPKQFKTGLGWQHPGHEGAEFGSALDHIEIYKFKYLRPVAKTADGWNTDLVSYLKFKNFDVANADRTKRLDGHNDLGVETSYESLGPILDGYRLMCFEFSDLMDDDVAYHNASYSGLVDAESRQDKLELLNSIGARETVYKIQVRLHDRTKEWVYDLYIYCNSILARYQEYCGTSRDICSFNNLTNSYNQFFIEAINDKFSDTKPWVEAAYAAVALSDILFNPDTMAEDAFHAAVMRELMRIAPSTGNLESTLNFEEVLIKLIGYLGPFSGTPTDTMTPRYFLIHSETAEQLNFYNQLKFGENNYGPIYGDLFPGLTAPDEFTPREGAPQIVLPSAAFMGGRTDKITTGGMEDWLPGDGRMTYEALWAGVVGETAHQHFDRYDITGADFYLAEGSGFSVDGDFITDIGADDEIGSSSAWIKILDPASANTAKQAYDEVFLPFSIADWRYKALTKHLGADAGYGAQTRDQITEDLVARPSEDWTMQGIVYSVAAKWAHEILMRSSVDAEVRDSSGYPEARRRGSNNAPSGRRDFRTMADLLYLIDYIYMPEAIRRVREEDNNRYSQVVRLRQNLGGWGMTEGARLGFHQNIKTTLSVMREKILYEITHPTNDARVVDFSWFAGTFTIAKDRSYMTLGLQNSSRDAEGISMVVSHDDYPGNSDFITLLDDPEGEWDWISDVDWSFWSIV